VTLKFLVDTAVPRATEVFAALGDVQGFDAARLRETTDLWPGMHVLISRSVTRIDDALLSRMPDLLAIACPIVGLDHVDFDALTRFRKVTGRECPLFSAPGSTADGVADWALAAMLELAWHATLDPARLRVGIWGFGQCGVALARRVGRIGATWIAYDPPLEVRSGGTFRSASLEALAGCEAISLHVPLTGPEESRWPTRHMVDRAFLGTWLRTANDHPRILVNTARGGVLHTAALTRTMTDHPGHILSAVDVWDDEPRPDPEFVKSCILATPHVAGSVIEGRSRALARVAEDVRRFLGLSAPSGWLAGLDPLPGGRKVPSKPLTESMLDRLVAAIGIRDVSIRFKADYATARDPAVAFETIRRQSMRHEIRWN